MVLGRAVMNTGLVPGVIPPKIHKFYWRDFRDQVRGASPPYSETEFRFVIGVARFVCIKGRVGLGPPE